MTERRFTVGSLLKQSNLAKERLNTNKITENENESKNKVVVKQHGTTYSVDVTGARESLLEAALGQKQNLDYKCTKGTCGRCEVEVISGVDFLSAITEKESEKLQDRVNEGHRLACQVEMN
ncbi:2Fe-2S iron-sulfur cluster-binding protein [Bacillus solitudinis]|uniref:2Fe-2S iron-sulfur cluster-binding protein n=1 Tax=Bacillus solitudinis TaxID=2014074 RepID=UPI0012FD367E|nr:2Fe-2S iron-sulfur cluster-binding protein [Bacillus solitudinis]